MALTERKKNVQDVDDISIDLKPFINFLVVLIPVLMLSSEFAKISVINLKLPTDLGSRTDMTQVSPPLNQADRLMLTMVVTDSVVTIAAKNGFLPSLWYKEFHQYVSADDRRVQTTMPYDPKDPAKTPLNPKTRKPFKIGERQEIYLYVTDENHTIQNCLYTSDGFMVTNADGKPLTSVAAGNSVWIVANPRREIVVQNPSQFHLAPLSVYDEMKNRLMKIKDRFRDASDADDIILAAESDVAYDKIVQLMDIARSADFPNISIAKLRS